MDKKYFPIKNDPACQLKWTWSTIYLHTGDTASCSRASRSKIDPDNFDLFHNTDKKIQARKLMLQGQWPGDGCEYCRDIELAGGESDRKLHLKIPNQVPPELDKNINEVHVSPRILEVYLNNTCNLSCVYCHGEYSSRISHENQKFNPTSNLDVQEYPTFEITKYKEVNYFDKLLDWLDHNSQTLSRLTVLGGEPFYQKEFDLFVNKLNQLNNPDLEIAIVTNLQVNNQKLEKYITQFKSLILQKKIKRLDITCSLDCLGPEQEYVRYGINLDLWQENFEYLLSQLWIVLNINQTVTTLTIKTMPDLIRKINNWKTLGQVNQYFSGPTPGPSYLKPDILGPDIFKQDFEKILELMPESNEQERTAKAYMEGIWLQISSSHVNIKEVEKMKNFLDEIDRRRNTNWRETFKWIP